MKTMTGRTWLRILSAMVLCVALLVPCFANVSATNEDVANKYGEEVIKIACIGDSVTFGVGGTPYPQQLQNKLGGFYEVKNFGVSGTTAQNDGHDQNINDPKKFGYRTANPATGDWNYGDVYRTVIPNSSGKTVYEQSQMYQADIYIIAIGGNDAKACNWRNGNNKYEEDYRALIQEYLDLPWHPLVIVGTSPAGVKSSYTLDINVLAEEIVPIQRKVAKEMGLLLVETFDHTVGQTSYYIDDGVHLNTPGYGVVADQYYKVIKKLAESPSGAKNLADTYGEEAVKIACIGDSVTVGIGGTPYPQQLQNKLGGLYQVTNFGVSGSTAMNEGHNESKNEKMVFGYRTAEPYPTTPDWMECNRRVIGKGVDIYGEEVEVNGTFQNGKMWADKTVYEQSKLYEADIYIIALGGNDAKYCNWNNGNNTFEEDYRALVQEYVNLPHHPIVIIGTSPAMLGHQNFNTDALENEIVPIQRKVAKEMGLPFVETYNYTVDQAGYFIDDGVHLNTAGYGVVAEQYYQAITAMTASLASAELTSFTADGVKGVIDNDTNSVYLSMPFGTDLTKLTATAQAGLVSVALEGDFTKPVTFTVTSPYGNETREYAVYTSIQRKVRVACVGDSVTAGGFPTQLQEILGEAYDVKNYGVNSTTAQKDGMMETQGSAVPVAGSGAYTKTGQYAQSIEYKPDIVFILLGSNDTKQSEDGAKNGDWNLITNWKDGSDKAFAEGLQDMIEVYRSIGATVVLGTSPRAFTTTWGVQPSIVTNYIVPIQRATATKLDCPLVDIYALTENNRELLGGDGLHPNDTGNQRIAEEYAKVVLAQEISAEARTPKDMLIEAMPEIVEYAFGTEMMDVTGGEVKVVYDDETIEIYPMRTAMISGFDGSVPGMQTITVTLQGLTTTFDVTVKSNVVYGDVDESGTVDSSDARVVLQAAVGKVALTETQTKAADVDGTDAVDSSDARWILQKSVNKIDVFPVEE